MNYVLEVANSLLARSHRVSILGPEIYAMIAEWEKKEIPLAIVMNSLDEIYGETGQSSGDMESTDRLKSVVDKNFAAWLQESE